MRTLSILCLLLCVRAAVAQSSDCQPLESTSSTESLLSDLFGEEARGISGACRATATDEVFAARITYRGFTGKAYRLTGFLLDANRWEIRGCEKISFDLPTGEGTADLTFRFDPSRGAYTTPYVNARYIKVSIAEADDILSEFDLGGVSLSGTSAEYRIDHRFRVGAGTDGNSRVVVSVGLTPIESAAFIKR